MSPLYFFLLSAVIISVCAIKCDLRLDAKGSGILTRKFGSKRLIVTPETSTRIYIDSDIPVEGYCASGFKNVGYQTPATPLTNVEFTCNTNGILYYRDVKTTSTMQVAGYGVLCENDAAFYQSQISQCQRTGLVYGFNLAQTSVVLAEVCYNLDTSVSSYVHYVTAVRSSVLEVQATLNPSNATISNVQSPIKFDGQFIDSENSALNNSILQNLQLYSKIVKYQLNQLVPLEQFIAPFGRIVGNFENVEMVPFWQPLKFGNWRDVDIAIANLGALSSSIYDVYAGTSGIVQCPDNQYCGYMNQLRYKYYGVDKAVPLYVWSYVQERLSSNEGVVIIGVNSPFFDGTNSTKTVFCDDNCDQFAWLKSLRARKMSAFGYVFCCRPQDAKKVLDGFPQ